MTLDLEAIEARAAKATEANKLIGGAEISHIHGATSLEIAKAVVTLKDAVQEFTALIAEVRRLLEALEWRTMESAPKDGTEIIAYRPDQGVFACRWSTMEELVAHDMNGDPIEDYNEDQEDWWHDRWGWLERELAPTLWMPFPNPSVQS